MRVLMLTETSHIGGAEVMIRNLSHELRRSGHEVGLVAPSNGGDWLHAAMETDGFPVWTFRLAKAINPDLIKVIETAIRYFKPDVVHSHLWVMAAYGGFVASRRSVPHVITMHGDGEQTRFLRRRIALRWSFRRARSVVVVSHAMKKDLSSSLGVPEHTFKVIPNGVDVGAVASGNLRSEIGHRGDDSIIVCVGSQIHRKNHISCVRALANLQGSHKATLIIVGPHGEATNSLEQEAAKLGVSSSVVNLGPRHDIREILAAADVFLMPSHWEGMPVALVEAMAAGLPVIASAVGGIPEMIEHGREGLLVPSSADHRTIANLLGQLLENPQMRTGLGEAAKAKAQSHFSVTAMAQAYLHEYAKRGT